MARGNHVGDLTTLQMALVGYEVQKQKIEDRISELRAALKGKRIPVTPGGVEVKSRGVKRVLSAAARRRIAAAQKKRWAEHRRRKAMAAKQSK